METRYYVIFAVTILALQVLIYIFNRTLGWLYGGVLSQKGRYIFVFTSYVFTNSVAILTATRLFPMFRLLPFIMVFLLFSLFVSLALVLLAWVFKNYSKIHRTLAWLYPIGMAGLIGLGVYNAYTPQIVHYQITLDKPIRPLRIGMASDFHLGKLFGAKQLDQLAEIFNQQKVDLILLPGDIMDDNVDAYLSQKMQPSLAKLQAPLGVYATLGNHDFFGDQQRIAEQIKQAGIKVLWDQTETINNEFVIVGRNDDLVKDRPSTAQLIQSVDTRLPIFVLDHRPTEIEQISQLPVDLLVAGHTHNGQIFPANFITKLIYRLAYGHEKIGNGHFIVTSGYGFWGVPMRLGTQSEVVIIDVKGKE
ncbi:metallophosphoesterase [Lonepinella sp. MS14435]|uniref:metallophosphoesterase n=1 Tax=Lonepinella sp. MS14435 TaxID=3003618 RepID=UPI0036DEC091